MLYHITRTVTEDADIDLDFEMEEDVVAYLEGLSPTELNNIKWSEIDVSYEIDTAEDE